MGCDRQFTQRFLALRRCALILGGLWQRLEKCRSLNPNPIITLTCSVIEDISSIFPLKATTLWDREPASCWTFPVCCRVQGLDKRDTLHNNIKIMLSRYFLMRNFFSLKRSFFMRSDELYFPRAIFWYKNFSAKNKI